LGANADCDDGANARPTDLLYSHQQLRTTTTALDCALCCRLWRSLDGGWLRHAGPGISSNMVGASVLFASSRRRFNCFGLAGIAFQATLP
jgi:hypothetical protein